MYCKVWTTCVERQFLNCKIGVYTQFQNVIEKN